MKQGIAADLLSRTANGMLTTTEVIERSGYSPNTVVRYLTELHRMGLIQKSPAEKPGVGRKPVVIRITPSGASHLRQLEAGFFRSLSSGGRVLWGPRQSLAFWGIPFFGRADVFSRDPVVAGPFEVVIETRDALYDDPIARGEDRYPSLESTIVWAVQSGNPRFLGAAAALLGHPRLRRGRLVAKAAEFRATNSLGFVASIVHATSLVSVLRPSPARERMLSIRTGLDPETRRLADKWKVENPASVSSVKGFVELYGGTEKRLDAS